jgi:hypothetical protein
MHPYRRHRRRQRPENQPFDRPGHQRVHPALSDDVTGYVLEFIEDARDVNTVDRRMRRLAGTTVTLPTAIAPPSKTPDALRRTFGGPDAPPVRGLTVRIRAATRRPARFPVAPGWGSLDALRTLNVLGVRSRANRDRPTVEYTLSEDEWRAVWSYVGAAPDLTDLRIELWAGVATLTRNADFRRAAVNSLAPALAGAARLRRVTFTDALPDAVLDALCRRPEPLRYARLALTPAAVAALGAAGRYPRARTLALDLVPATDRNPPPPEGVHHTGQRQFWLQGVLSAASNVENVVLGLGLGGSRGHRDPPFPMLSPRDRDAESVAARQRIRGVWLRGAGPTTPEDWWFLLRLASTVHLRFDAWNAHSANVRTVERLLELRTRSENRIAAVVVDVFVLPDNTTLQPVDKFYSDFAAVVARNTNNDRSCTVVFHLHQNRRYTPLSSTDDVPVQYHDAMAEEFDQWGWNAPRGD